MLLWRAARVKPRIQCHVYHAEHDHYDPEQSEELAELGMNPNLLLNWKSAGDALRIALIPSLYFQ